MSSITGATGFLGLALVVKLLRESPCHRLYLLVRRGERDFWDHYRQILPQDQLQEIRTERDICILNGDISKPGLGLEEDDISHLKANVNIFVHLAYSISLCRTLPVITKSVIDPTLELAKIALAASSLERFVYISTAYSNAHLHHLHEGIDTSVCERIYPLRAGGGDSRGILVLSGWTLIGTHPFCMTSLMRRSLWMTEEERRIFPLFMRSAEELGDVVKRRAQVRNQLERWFSRKGFPLLLIELLISRPVSLNGKL